jgi:hypothetical protein
MTLPWRALSVVPGSRRPSSRDPEIEARRKALSPAERKEAEEISTELPKHQAQMLELEQALWKR